MDIEKGVKIVGALVTIVGLTLSVLNYLATAKKDAESRGLEARKQFLTRQFDLYTEATKTASKLATLEEKSKEFQQARARFMELYWGELSMVENRKVELAMVNLKTCLETGACSICSASNDLRHCVLNLAHECRESMAESWGIPEWRYDDGSPKPR